MDSVGCANDSPDAHHPDGSTRCGRSGHHARSSRSPGSAREISLLGLVATALGAMVGVGVNVMPFMIQKAQPGVAGAVPDRLHHRRRACGAGGAVLCHSLGRDAAGGWQLRDGHARAQPFAGFIASFAQWFGLSMGIGVVAYFLVPVLRDFLATAGATGLAPMLDRSAVPYSTVACGHLVGLVGEPHRRQGLRADGDRHGGVDVDRPGHHDGDGLAPHARRLRGRARGDGHRAATGSRRCRRSA